MTVAGSDKSGERGVMGGNPLQKQCFSHSVAPDELMAAQRVS